VTDLKAAHNLLIQRMSEEDRRRLAADFVYEPMEFKHVLLEQDEPIARIYFVESGVMSMVTSPPDPPPYHG